MRNLSAFQPNGLKQIQLADTSLFSDANLVSYWKLEDLNDSKGSNNLTNNNTATFVPGKFNNAANFVRSSSQYLSKTDDVSLDLSADMSISFWLKLASLPGTNETYGLVTKDNTYGIYYQDNAGTKRFGMFSVLSSSYTFHTFNTTLSTATQYFVTWTKSGATSTLYINGVSVSSGSATATMDNTAGSLFLGLGDGAGEYLNGQLDDVAIFSKALTAAEVSQLYYSGSTKAYYPLNGNSNDFSGNTNTGTDTAITYPQGRFGQGALFNNSSSSITFTTVPATGANPFTASVWFKTTNSGTLEAILHWGTAASNQGFDFYISSTNKLTANFYGGGGIIATTPSVNNGIWHNGLATYDGTNIRLYYDGQFVGAGGNVTANIGTTYKNIGKDSGGGNFFGGTLDEIILESRAWTAKEVETYYRKSVLNYKGKQSLAQVVYTYLMQTVAGAYTYTGIEQFLLYGRKVALAVGAFVLTGVELTFSRGYGIFANAGSYILTGINAILRSSQIWTKQSKNTSSWTDQTKNSSTWTNQDRS